MLSLLFYGTFGAAQNIAELWTWQPSLALATVLCGFDHIFFLSTKKVTFLLAKVETVYFMFIFYKSKFNERAF